MSESTDTTIVLNVRLKPVDNSNQLHAVRTVLVAS